MSILIESKGPSENPLLDFPMSSEIPSLNFCAKNPV